MRPKVITPQQRSGDSSFGLDHTSHGPHGRYSTSNNQVQNSSGEKARSRKQKNPQRLHFRRFMELNNRNGFVIPRLHFGRLVRKIINSVSTLGITHMTREALEGIQESTEMYMTQVFNDAYQKRETLSVEDLQFLKLFKLIVY